MILLTWSSIPTLAYSAISQTFAVNVDPMPIFILL